MVRAALLLLLALPDPARDAWERPSSTKPCYV
jgi:hypothetical protein